MKLKIKLGSLRCMDVKRVSISANHPQLFSHQLYIHGCCNNVAGDGFVRKVFAQNVTRTVEFFASSKCKYRRHKQKTFLIHLSLVNKLARAQIVRRRARWSRRKSPFWGRQATFWGRAVNKIVLLFWLRRLEFAQPRGRRQQEGQLQGHYSARQNQDSEDDLHHCFRWVFFLVLCAAFAWKEVCGARLSTCLGWRHKKTTLYTHTREYFPFRNYLITKFLVSFCLRRLAELETFNRALRHQLY